MKSFSLAALVALVGLSAFGCAHEEQKPAQPNQAQIQKQQQEQAHARAEARARTPAAGIPLPSDARLVASSTVEEIRAFPELAGQAQTQPQAVGQAQPAPEAITDVSATDNVYLTNKKYRDAVKFLDDQMKAQGLKPLVRAETPTATAWTVQLQNGTLENVVVRNTQPTSIETISAKGTEAQVAP